MAYGGIAIPYTINPTKTVGAGAPYYVYLATETALFETISIDLNITSSIQDRYIYNFDNSLKKITCSSSYGHGTSLNITLDKITLTAEAGALHHADASFSLGKISVSASIGTGSNTYNLATSLKKIIASIASTTEIYYSLNQSIKKPVVSMSSIGYNEYSLAIRIKPTLVLGIERFPVYELTALTKKIILNLTYSSASEETPTTVTWVMNVESKGHWTYDDFEFNSIVRHNGEYYVGTSDGLYKLTTPAVPTITGEVQTPTISLNGDMVSFVHDVYLGCRGDNVIELKTITDEEYVAEYTVDARSDKVGRHTKRVSQLAKGICGNNWSFNLKNSAGSNMNLNSIDIRSVASRRSA